MRAGYILYGGVVLLFGGVLVIALLLRSTGHDEVVTPLPTAATPYGDRSSNAAAAARISPVERVATVVAELPHDIKISDRIIQIDAITVPTTTRASFASLPYEVMVDGEASLIEATISVRPTETLTDLIARFVERRIPPTTTLSGLDESAYQTSVSVYPLTAVDTPVSVESTAQQPGVSVYVRRMNLPDLIVGGREDRIDLVATATGWQLLWVGERTYCLSSSDGNWQPANIPCQ